MKIGQGLGLIVFVVSLYVVWQIRQLLLLGFTAIVLSTAINGVVRQLQRWRFKRGWAVVLTVLLLAVLAIAIVWLVVPSFIQQFGELVATFPIGLSEIQQGIDWIENHIINPYFPNIPDFNGSLSQLQPVVANLSRQAISLFATSINELLECLTT
jgi:predicted PurR-regulated permease PerM